MTHVRRLTDALRRRVDRLLPVGVLDRVQFLLLLVPTVATPLVGLLLLTDDAEHRGWPVPSVAVACALQALWALGYRLRAFPWPLVLAEFCLLTVGAAVQGTNGWLALQAMAAIFFRTSIGTTRDAGVLMVSWTTALSAGFLAAPTLGLVAFEDYRVQDWIYTLTTVALLAMPVRIVVSVLARYEAAVSRERALLSAGTALVATASPDEVGAVAVRAAESLVEGTGGVVRWLDGALLDGVSEDVLVVGPEDVGPTRTALGLDAQPTHAVVVAVTAEDHRRLLLIETAMPLPATVVEALVALASTLSLGLRSVADAHELRRRAHEDPLTGLANRALLEQRLAAAAARSADADDTTAAVMLIDLDGFKQVNDQLGHAAGDTVLVTVASRLRGCARAGDLVARLGGDEFVVLVEHLQSEDDVITLADRVVLALSTPFHVAGVDTRVSGSVGVAVLAPGTSASAALEAADTAMYAAKAAGKSTYVMAPAAARPEVPKSRKRPESRDLPVR